MQTVNMPIIAATESARDQKLYPASDTAETRINVFLNSQKSFWVWLNTPLMDSSTVLYKVNKDPESYHTMLASEKVLGRDWNTPEEDEAWANL